MDTAAFSGSWVTHGIFFFPSAWQGWCPQETWHGPQCQNQQLNCVFAWNGHVLCFGALFFFWNSGHSWWSVKIHLFIFFIPISFPHGQVPCSGCGQHCLQCYLMLVSHCWASGHAVSTKAISAHPELGQPVGKESSGSCGLHTDSCLQEQLVGLKLRCDSLKGAFHSTDDVRKVSNTITHVKSYASPPVVVKGATWICQAAPWLQCWSV